MKRTEQEYINALCNTHFTLAMNELWEQEYHTKKTTERERLCSCQAWVFETPSYYILKSYNTYIACMDKETENVYDVLRTEYGYTVTSAKHIAKFDSLTCYGGYKTSYNNERFTARPL